MLTTYAQAHLIMVAIDRRFEAVIARNPIYTKVNIGWRVAIARTSARWQRDSLAQEIELFELCIKTPSKDHEWQTLVHQNQYIEALRKHRQIYGSTLFAAKTAVDAYRENQS